MQKEGAISDPAGNETLELFAEAPGFNRWLFSEIAPFCGKQILEIGSGIGNISSILLEQDSSVTLSDLRPEYCSILRERFAQHPKLKEVVQIDLAAPDFTTRYAALLNTFDTVIALNVVEHIADDKLAIANCRALLKKNGSLIVLVPAYQLLFNRFDTALGHFRRYTRQSLKTLLSTAGTTILQTKYFNFAGLFGWWFSGALLKKKTIPKGQLHLFEKLVPVFRLTDKLLLKSAGLSVIGIARVNA
ncbi:MAG: class I SAM-dependent methyltransferase [Chitinophagaceae bacterium]